MAMRQDDEIQVGEINALRLYVRREDVAIIACVEQDALAGDLYERGEAPVLFHRGILAERIVEDRDLGFGADGRCSRAYQGGGTGEGACNEPCQVELHGRCSFWLS